MKLFLSAIYLLSSPLLQDITTTFTEAAVIPPGEYDLCCAPLAGFDFPCNNPCDPTCNACMTLETYCEFFYEGDPDECTLEHYEDACTTIDFFERRALVENWALHKGNEISKLSTPRKLQDRPIPTWCPICKQGVGFCGGDPHFQTWSGDYFDYHAECDLVFLQAPQFGKGVGLDIHIRTKASMEFSYIESAAVRIGDDILEVSSYGTYSFNGVEDTRMPKHMAGMYPVTYKQINKKRHELVVHLSKTESITIVAFKNLVSVKMNNSTKTRFGNSVGLMGDFQSGKMLARDGITIMEDPNEFGQEWQVLQTEAKLFETDRAPQHPQACTPPRTDFSKEHRRLGEQTVTQEEAEEACDHWGEHKQLCVYDVMAMEDLEVAEAGAY